MSFFSSVISDLQIGHWLSTFLISESGSLAELIPSSNLDIFVDDLFEFSSISLIFFSASILKSVTILLISLKLLEIELKFFWLNKSISDSS